MELTSCLCCRFPNDTQEARSPAVLHHTALRFTVASSPQGPYGLLGTRRGVEGGGGGRGRGWRGEGGGGGGGGRAGTSTSTFTQFLSSDTPRRHITLFITKSLSVLHVTSYFNQISVRPTQYFLFITKSLSVLHITSYFNQISVRPTHNFLLITKSLPVLHITSYL